jgi:hypothetical protein
MAAVRSLQGVTGVRKILQFFQPDQRLIAHAPLP